MSQLKYYTDIFVSHYDIKSVAFLRERENTISISLKIIICIFMKGNRRNQFQRFPWKKLTFHCHLYLRESDILAFKEEKVLAIFPYGDFVF